MIFFFFCKLILQNKRHYFTVLRQFFINIVASFKSIITTSFNKIGKIINFIHRTEGWIDNIIANIYLSFVAVVVHLNKGWRTTLLT